MYQFIYMKKPVFYRGFLTMDKDKGGIMERCKWIEVTDLDWQLVCEPDAKEEVKKEEVEDGGSFLGWLKCAMSCLHFTHGFDYINNKCLCKGEWRTSALWKR